MKIYSFEKLDVWKISKEFAKHIYQITDKFPYKERKGIIDQLQRAALSIPNNLAEGSGRITAKDKAKYTTIAYGSLMECLNLIIISHDKLLIKTVTYKELRNEIEEISRKLSNLRRSQLQKTNPLNY